MEGYTVGTSQRLWTWIAVVALLAFVAAACSQGTTTESTSTTATTAPGASSFTYKLGILKDIRTDNFWAYMDPEATVWTRYVLGNQHPALFTLAAPSWQLVPDLATGQPNNAEQVGDDWDITQELREGYMWSDGTPVTANDVAFTFNTAADFKLGGNWAAAFRLYAPDDPATTDVDESAEGIKSVEAVDDYTVKITFSSEPGLAVWQMGVGLMPILPQHFWQSVVDEAAASDDPSTTLYAASGEGEPSAGALIYDSREPGAYAKNVANPNAYYAGTQYTFYSDGTFEQANADGGFDEKYDGTGTGDITLQYSEGPFAKDVIYSIYSDQNAAILALKSGEIDFVLSPTGLSAGLKDEVLNSPGLSLIANPSNGFRYLAFNLRTSPMKYKGFRQAIGCLTQKEFLQTLLGGAIIPMYSLIPELNSAWANPNVEQICKGLGEQERFDQAIQYLKDAGFTWAVEPAWDGGTAGNLLPGTGTGLTDPDGKAVPELELLAPGPGYDPQRSTASIWIAQWSGWMGITVKATITDFNVLVDKVFATGDDARDWDMYILSWGGGNPALPDFHEVFFASWQDSADGGFNTPGYNDTGFDALAKDFLAATDIPSAKVAVQKMDAKIVQDLPYLVLFTTPVLEAYNSKLVFPFTNVLDGLANLNGMPAAVHISD